MQLRMRMRARALETIGELRDHLLHHKTLEAAYIGLVRSGFGAIPHFSSTSLCT